VTIHLPKDCRTWRYSFYWRKKRFFGTTGLSNYRAAEQWEQKFRESLELEAAGLKVPTPAETPRFTDWATVYDERAATKVTRPDRIRDLLRVVLRFWGVKPSGANPKNPVIEGEPYHDLRLGDAIARPQWIADFEDWMDARGVAGQTKNQYRSTVRQMYQLALQPRWRSKTGIQTNPMDGIYRDRPGGREVTIEPEAMRRLLTHASYHVRLAIAIGALAPKLRLANILALEWGVHLDAEYRYITVQHHKTVTTTRRPLVIPVSAQLRAILLDARRRTRSAHVVTYRGQPIKTLRGGLKAAAKAAGVTYGRFVDDGATFHTLRHTAATILADLDVSESKRKSVMGHRHIGTTQKYTHLRPVHELKPLELLSAELPIEDLVTVSWRRARRARPVSTPVQLGSGGNEKPRE
jgi:integrase